MQDKFNINVTFLAKAAKHSSVTENKKFEFPKHDGLYTNE